MPATFSNYVLVVSATANKFVARVRVGAASQSLSPLAVLYDPANKDAYVTTAFSMVAINSQVTNSVSDKNGGPEGMVFAGSNSYLYSANSGLNSVPVVSS